MNEPRYVSREMKERRPLPRTTRRTVRPAAQDTARAVAEKPVEVVHVDLDEVTHLRDFPGKSAGELEQLARDEGVRDAAELSRPQLTTEILRARARRGHALRGEGTLEVLPEGYGFLRNARASYLSSPEDIYVSPAQIRRLGLRTGMTVAGLVRPPLEGQQYFALLEVQSVDGGAPETVGARVPFAELKALHPDERLRLEAGPDDLNLRVVDLVTPVGKGQRGLIVAPPRTGKTVLLQKIANGVLH